SRSGRPTGLALCHLVLTDPETCMNDAILIEAALRTQDESPTGIEGWASDALVRTIAANFYTGADDESYAFVSTGSIPDNPVMLWRQLEPDPEATIPADRRALGFLGVYLLRHAGRGTVDGWAELWLRPGQYPAEAPQPAQAEGSA
ncbi:hypothetical protein ACFQ68_44675, partial [Amycolatopsis japonica]|uniref:hypothetical protein n=1 Tax=Amycolatopsis japonica TaxID=208439 RepID=UPI003672051C